MSLRDRLAFTSALLVGLAAGCSTTPPGMMMCKQSSDCKPGTGVCRGDTCKAVMCNMTNMPCMANEKCEGGMCVPGQSRMCKSSLECPPGEGVCRNMLCVQTPCSMAMPCMGDEVCSNGKCLPPAKGTPGRTLAAGGSVSTSGKHIHIGLTGQGRAVGPGSTQQHSHVTGATSVMGR